MNERQRLLLIGIAGIIVTFLSACEVNTTPSPSSPLGNKEQQVGNNIVFSEGLIKGALEKWSLSLPTEYRLGKINEFCDINHNTSCKSLPENFTRSTIIEGYSRTFTKASGDAGTLNVFLFNTNDEAEQQFSSIVEDVIEERGYTEIKTSDNCYGWEKDLTMVVVDKMCCHLSNVFFQLNIQGMVFINDDIDELHKQFENFLINEMNNKPEG